MLSIEQIKEYRRARKRKWFNHLWHYIAPKIEEGYSYGQVVDWLKEEHQFILSKNVLAVIISRHKLGKSSKRAEKASPTPAVSVSAEAKPIRSFSSYIEETKIRQNQEAKPSEAGTTSVSKQDFDALVAEQKRSRQAIQAQEEQRRKEAEEKARQELSDDARAEQVIEWVENRTKNA